MDDRTLRYWVAFNRVKGIGAARFHALLSYFNGDLEAAWRAHESDLLNALVDVRAANSLLKARQSADLDADLAAVASYGAHLVTLQDEAYPPLLRAIDNPPPILYVRGTLEPTDQVAVAIVGTRTATSYGLRVAQNLCAELVGAGLTIISGLAKGIDSASHLAAIENGGRTLALLAHGIDQLYPRGNRELAAQVIEHGALITEFPIGAAPESGHFPQRNRLISGMALGVLVVEARPDSGALSTAHHALDQGREVFAVPGSIYAPESQGTNLLIQTGEAKLVGRAEDIIAELNLNRAKRAPDAKIVKLPKPVRHAVEQTADLPKPERPKVAHPEPADLSETEQKVWGCLSDTPVYIDELCSLCDLPMVQVLVILSMMELRGLVQQVNPKSYIQAR